jgi:hypothetical protein
VQKLDFGSQFARLFIAALSTFATQWLVVATASILSGRVPQQIFDFGYLTLVYPTMYQVALIRTPELILVAVVWIGCHICLPRRFRLTRFRLWMLFVCAVAVCVVAIRSTAVVPDLLFSFWLLGIGMLCARLARDLTNRIGHRPSQ